MKDDRQTSDMDKRRDGGLFLQVGDTEGGAGRGSTLGVQCWSRWVGTGFEISTDAE